MVLVSGIAILVTIFDRSTNPNYQVVYDVFVGLVASLSILIVVVFGIVGAMAMKQLIAYGQKKMVIVFSFLFVVFLTMNFLRFFFLFYSTIFNKHISYFLHRLFTYVVPDISCSALIILMQFNLYRLEKQKSKGVTIEETE